MVGTLQGVISWRCFILSELVKHGFGKFLRINMFACIYFQQLGATVRNIPLLSVGAALTQGFAAGIVTMSPSRGYGKTQSDSNNVRHPVDEFCLRVVL